MKTYADLTDEQLKELYRLLMDDPDEQNINVNRKNLDLPTPAIFVEWYGGDNGNWWVTFYTEDGSFYCHENDGEARTPENVWQVIALLKSWGVDYTPAPQS